jgi:hypothetical protein
MLVQKLLPPQLAQEPEQPSSRPPFQTSESAHAILPSVALVKELWYEKSTPWTGSADG